MTDKQHRILEALGVLVDADIADVTAALDSLEDEQHELDPYARDRTLVAVRLLRAADDEVTFLVESLALSCAPEHRRIPGYMKHWREMR